MLLMICLYLALLFGAMPAYQVTPCLNGIQSNHLRDLQDGMEIRTTKLHLSRINDTSDSTDHSPHLCNISLNANTRSINLTFSTYVNSTLYYCPKVNNNPHYWVISEKSGPICNIPLKILDKSTSLPVPVTFSWKSNPITEFNVTFEADEIITITPGEFDVLTLTTLVVTTGDTSVSGSDQTDDPTSVSQGINITGPKKKAGLSIGIIVAPVAIVVILVILVVILIIFFKYKRKSKSESAPGDLTELESMATPENNLYTTTPPDVPASSEHTPLSSNGGPRTNEQTNANGRVISDEAHSLTDEVVPQIEEAYTTVPPPPLPVSPSQAQADDSLSESDSDHGQEEEVGGGLYATADVHTQPEKETIPPNETKVANTTLPTPISALPSLKTNDENSRDDDGDDNGEDNDDDYDDGLYARADIHHQPKEKILPNETDLYAIPDNPPEKPHKEEQESGSDKDSISPIEEAYASYPVPPPPPQPVRQKQEEETPDCVYAVPDKTRGKTGSGEEKEKGRPGEAMGDVYAVPDKKRSADTMVENELYGTRPS